MRFIEIVRKDIPYLLELPGTFLCRYMDALMRGIFTYDECCLILCIFEPVKENS